MIPALLGLPADPAIGSLCSGYGGLDLGVIGAVGGHVVWHADNDPAAAKVLAARWPGTPNLGDITALDWRTVPPVDILCGGFPCQDLSTAGLQAGLVDGETRSGLWGEIARAIAVLRPRLVIIENVRGLLTARGAAPSDELTAAEHEIARLDRAFATIRRRRRKATRDRYPTTYYDRDTARLMAARKRAVATRDRAERRLIRAVGTVLGALASLGFDAEWRGVRASDVGAPHGRFRVFIVAWTAADADRPGRERAEPARRSDVPARGPAADPDGEPVRLEPVGQP